MRMRMEVGTRVVREGSRGDFMNCGNVMSGGVLLPIVRNLVSRGVLKSACYSPHSLFHCSFLSTSWQRCLTGFFSWSCTHRHFSRTICIFHPLITATSKFNLTMSSQET